MSERRLLGWQASRTLGDPLPQAAGQGGRPSLGGTGQGPGTTLDSTSSLSFDASRHMGMPSMQSPHLPFISENLAPKSETEWRPRAPWAGAPLTPAGLPWLFSVKGQCRGLKRALTVA